MGTMLAKGQVLERSEGEDRAFLFIASLQAGVADLLHKKLEIQC
jgi:hypothetical protein